MTEPVSPVEGAEGWHYGPFGSEPEEGLIVVPLVRDDGERGAPSERAQRVAYVLTHAIHPREAG